MAEHCDDDRRRKNGDRRCGSIAVFPLLLLLSSLVSCNGFGQYQSTVRWYSSSRRANFGCRPHPSQVLRLLQTEEQQSSSSQSDTIVPLTLTSTDDNKISVIVPPPLNIDLMKKNGGIHGVGSFPNTTFGSVSVASMNLLAPFYHVLSEVKFADDIDPVKHQQQVNDFLERDRTDRVPKSVRMAKQTNADILCLQEIEGLTVDPTSPSSLIPGTPINVGLGFHVEKLLSEEEIYHYSCSNDDEKSIEKTLRVQGYDSYIWTSLMPNNKRGDPVGLCVAWRSHRHSLVSWEGFKRGMVCQFQEVCKEEDSESSGGTFAIANLHLPARPSNILGRLKTMSRTVQKLAAMDDSKPPNRSASALNGLVMVAGDFNSDQKSVAAQLLQRGSSPYGNLRDRNYKVKVTKASALEMRHGYSFYDVYDANLGDNPSTSIREKYAPVTVSLKGRGPGCMDHLFYALPSSKSKSQGRRGSFSGKIERADDTSKRRQRRKKAESRQKLFQQAGGGSIGKSMVGGSSRVRVVSVLATVGDDDRERMETVLKGMPNEGYPSDHLPVGALFVSRRISEKNQEGDGSFPTNNEEAMVSGADNTSKSGISAAIKRRRESSKVSIGLRRRHNAVLNLVAEWLIERGLSDVIRDQPLYKNALLIDAGVSEKLKRKSRSPDLMGLVFENGDQGEGDSLPSLLIVEIAVASDPSRVRRQKLSKYEDLIEVISNSSTVFSACHLLALVFQDDGSIPKESIQDIERLASMTRKVTLGEETEEELGRFRIALQGVVATSIST